MSSIGKMAIFVIYIYVYIRIYNVVFFGFSGLAVFFMAETC